MLLIFDLDGTLLNTIADLGAACNVALKANGYAEHRLEDYPKLVGNGVNKLIERSLPDGHKDEATVLRLKETFIPYYDAHNRVHTCAYEGIPEVIDQLKKDGHTLAVASNKYDAATKQLVHHYFGENTFDIVLGERQGIERKPHPQIVYDILNALKFQPEQGVLYIGDSDVDMQTAKNAGLTSVACTWGFCQEDTLRACRPDHIIHQATELLDIVKGCSK